MFTDHSAAKLEINNQNVVKYIPGKLNLSV